MVLGYAWVCLFDNTMVYFWPVRVNWCCGGEHRGHNVKKPISFHCFFSIHPENRKPLDYPLFLGGIELG